MTDEDTERSDLHVDRRTALRTLGTAGVVASGVGIGSYVFSGRGAALDIAIGATNPNSISNDRGDLSKVTVDPTFRVEWENFDTAIGKVFYVIEGRVGSGSNQTDWWPLFRSTPWLTPGSLSGVDESRPGTTGHLELTAPLSKVLRQSSVDRGAVDEDPRNLPRPIQVVNELGRPDYDSASGYPNSTADYLNGFSVGSADSATANLDNGQIATDDGEAEEYGTSSLTGDDVPDGSLPLVNNFPGAESGYYGAASNTDLFDTGQDGDSTTTNVDLRYTFALYTIDESSVQFFTANDLNNDYNGNIDEAARQDPNLQNVRPSDIKNDSGGNSVLVMNGEDGYPDLTNNGTSSPASNDYDALQAIANDHPAVISTTSSFEVTVENETAESGVTGDSNAGASGGGQ